MSGVGDRMEEKGLGSLGLHPCSWHVPHPRFHQLGYSSPPATLTKKSPLITKAMFWWVITLNALCCSLSFLQ